MSKTKVKSLSRMNWFDYLNYFIMFLIILVLLRHRIHQ